MSARNGRHSSTLARTPARSTSRTPTLSQAAAKREQRRRLTKSIERCRRDSYPTLGIDSLLARPIEAMKLSADVARDVDLVTPEAWHVLTAAINVFQMQIGEYVPIIERVCREAMNGRKRGHHKPASKGGKP
jgi:hypothetical protein